MTLGFLLFTIGLALLASAIKNQSVADIFKGVTGGDGPFFPEPTYAGAGSSNAQQQPSDTDPALLQYLQKEAHDKFGLTITEPIGRDSGGHVADSLHKSGRAFDASGTAKQMAAFTQFVRKNFGKSVTELIHNPGGSIKNGKPVAPSFWGNVWGEHVNHVHVGI